MARCTDWHDLEGENAFLVVGTVARLLKQLEREAGSGLADRYRAEAMAGDYEHLMDTSHAYAFEHLRDTLNVPEARP